MVLREDRISNNSVEKKERKKERTVMGTVLLLGFHKGHKREFSGFLRWSFYRVTGATSQALYPFVCPEKRELTSRTIKVVPPPFWDNKGSNTKTG